MTLNPDTTSGVYSVEDLPPRLASKILIDPETGCWLFQASDSGEGYVQVCWNGRHPVAHRVVYELLVGPIPPDLVLDHVAARGCRYRHCCWPAHLEPVTQSINVLRGLHPDGWPPPRCRAGHEFTPENIYVYKGYRQCRTCRRKRVQEWEARKRAARRATR